MNRDSWPRWQFVRYSFKMSCMERADISWLYQPRMVRRVCCKFSARVAARSFCSGALDCLCPSHLAWCQQVLPRTVRLRKEGDCYISQFVFIDILLDLIYPLIMLFTD